MADGTHACCGQSWIDGCACNPGVQWVWAPYVPTEAMLKAAEREWDGRMSFRSTGAWQAMLDAAPVAPEYPFGEPSEGTAPPQTLDVPCSACGGNGYQGGVNTGSGEYDDACEMCYGSGNRPSPLLVGVSGRIDAKLASLFPEWEWDQRNAIADDLARAALSDSDGSPKGGDGDAGSVHDGAGRETASPHTSPPSSPQAG